MEICAVLSIILLFCSVIGNGMSKNRDFRHKEQLLDKISRICFLVAMPPSLWYFGFYIADNGIYLINLIEEWAK